MTIASPAKTGYEKWQDGIKSAADDPKWQIYDCELRAAVGEYNRHLAGVAGYRPLDWRLIKAMAWVETGAGDPLWASNPMQIGMYDDPGLDGLLSGKEGGDLILPASTQSRLTRANARAVPAYNIRAAIGYLLMRLANFSMQSVPDPDRRTYEISVRPGDSLDKIARQQGSTIDTLRALNPGVGTLRPGQLLKYQKAAIRKVIIGWKPMTTANVGRLYNTKAPGTYAKKLDYALATIQQGKEPVCSP
ncbi:LysM peptidoglycan-binding domain-containing protein [Burkholderia sp. AU18528]|uniref:LysM domain-containing protein n=1 Tax=Burkholderia anthinoferrum TaxID=3090833 RepID=A0ABU5WR87_9BURK|nr:MULTISPECIES: LysM domain-containing protein [Burkholderia]MEB2505248.1 LysM domain-containing protein [Burkholderia anthinoferrum]MEB2534485.1 LysM domain-containing protein [Burkholderia anthinoferrum]MEB2562499.1 LysM domain-containing protein [Burkholderia anthinoferrum]MEB2581424.1 LysM domain-containing protein [Burkholderia anthinoferrum]KVH05002.1 peptidoglycan-binding protein [Burkholderia anthina]